VRGHSFHCSEANPAQGLSTAYQVSYSLSGRHEREGYSKGRVLASYIHLHFRANPSIVQSFLSHTRRTRPICQESPSKRLCAQTTAARGDSISRLSNEADA
jgi:cobyrinic acid a,c-diamide synthase